MLNRELYKDDVLQAGELLKKVLSPDIESDRNLFKKGLLLYRGGSVYNVKSHPSLVSAKVQDVTPVHVELHLPSVDKSTCSCPNGFPCRHLIAVFLYVYAGVDRVGTYIEAWKEESSPDILAHLKKGALGAEPELTDSSLQSWLSYFDYQHQRWASNPDNLRMASSSLYHRLYPRLKDKKPRSFDLQRFYSIHTSLAVFLYILMILNKSEPRKETLQHSTYSYVDQLLDNISRELTEMKRYALPFALDPLLDDSVDRFRELLTASDFLQKERLLLYRMLWTALLNRDKWISKERSWLLSKAEEEDDEVYQLALMHMDFLQRKDEQLFQRLHKLSDEAFPVVLNWFSELSAKKDYKRSAAWAEYLISNAGSYLARQKRYEEKRSVVRNLLPIIRDYTDFSKANTVFAEACRSMLPYSYGEYSIFLLDQRDYKTWVELHSLLGYSIHDLDAVTVKEAAKEVPESLIPIYHQSIASEISFKTRENYRQAVRQLKKLRTLYKKLKREEEFENFMLQLSEKHRRLRAFQEELKKGKLIHA
ncbi:SWIM zinc finger family protein [Metabacillus lacus]|nr:SWIM zinc finger family protein [Metabacillus lacus]